MINLKQLVIEKNNKINKFILLEGSKLDDLIVEDTTKKSIVNNIYCGRVLNIVNKKFAFINIGLEKNAFLDLSDTKEQLQVEDLGNKRKLKLKQGDAVLVQVLKDATNEKGVAVTTQINLKGEYLAIFKAHENQIGISKKIKDIDERERLKKVGETLTKGQYSLIFRTNSENISEEEIEKDYLKLKDDIEKLFSQSDFVKPPALIKDEKNGILASVKEILTDDTEKIISNDENILNELKDNINIETEHMYGEQYLKFLQVADKQIDKLFNKSVWLKSGGFIVIEETEACVVIDVNTSRSVKTKQHKEIALKTNKEAVDEIAKQLKFRNLCGMIIIDFIDMRQYKQKDELLKYAKYVFNKDRTKTFVVNITELGLMQLTRKKTREPISRILKRPCIYCGGVGTLPRLDVTINKIFKDVFGLLIYTAYNDITICANEKIIDEIKLKNIPMFESLQNKYNVKINYKPIKTGRVDYYEIEKNKI